MFSIKNKFKKSYRQNNFIFTKLLFKNKKVKVQINFKSTPRHK